MTAYTLPDLRYDYTALEPHISGRILELRFETAQRLTFTLDGAG